MWDAVEQVLVNAQWDEKMVPQWINDITEKAMKELMALNRPYKFMGKLFISKYCVFQFSLFFQIIVTVMLMQRTQQSGAQSVLSCTWENTTDGRFTSNFIQPKSSLTAALNFTL